MNRQLIKNTLIIALGRLSTQFLMFLMLPLYTSRLDVNDYGRVELTATYVVLFAPLVSLQLEMGLFREIIDAREKSSRITELVSATVDLVGRAILIAAFFTLIVFYFWQDRLLWIAFAAVVATILSNLSMQIARGLGDNVNYSLTAFLIGVFNVSSSYIQIAVFKHGAESILISLAFGNFAGFIFLFLKKRIYRSLNLKESHKPVRATLIRYSLPLVPNGISWWGVNASGSTIIVLFLGVAANGIYAVAYKFPAIFSGLYSFFNLALTEQTSINVEKKDRDLLFTQSFDLGLRTYGSLALVVIASIPVFFDFLIGENFSDAYYLIPPLVFGAFFSSLVSMVGSVYIAKRLTKQVMYSSVIASVVTVLFSLATVKWIGLLGPAIAPVIGYGTMLIYRIVDIRKYVDVRFKLSTSLILLSSSILVTVSYYARLDQVALITFVCSIILFGALNWNLLQRALGIIKAAVAGRNMKQR